MEGLDRMVGYEFRPSDDELVGFYLRHQLQGNTSPVERAITEVDIYKFDPWILRSQSKMKSRDPVWYFLSQYVNGTRQKRTTSSGFWKITGDPADVKDQWGIWSGVRGHKIGYKRFLGFHKGRNSEKTTCDWHMQEFHYDLLQEPKRTYVICRLEYKGDDMNILFDYPTDHTPTFVANATNSKGSVVNQSRQGYSGSYNTYSEYDSANHCQQFNDNFNMQQSVQGNLVSLPFPEYDLANHGQSFSDYCNLQQQVSYLAPDDEISDIIRNFLIDDIPEITSMQEYKSDHRPKTPVTRFLVNDSSDSETDSMTCSDTTTDSVCSSNEPKHTLTDDISSLNTIEPLHIYEARGQPKQPKLHLQGEQKVINTQKSECEWKMAEDSIKKTPSNNTVKHNWIVSEEMSQRNSQWNYLKNMIIGFLVLISIIVWIIMV